MVTKLEKRIAYSVRNPYMATVTRSINLCHESPLKSTRHIEVALADSGLDFIVGDSLGIMPLNSAELVDETIEAGRLDPDRVVKTQRNGVLPLREALIRSCDITKPSKKFLEWLAEITQDRELLNLTALNDRKAIDEYVWGKHVIDLLIDFPKVVIDEETFVGKLKPLQPRLYSIASSPLMYPNEAHLTVAPVKYESYNRQRWGVCTYNLCELFAVGDQLPVFISEARHFRLPEQIETPIIMVGPGTGIAPFRAFLQERWALGANSRNWLFFGNPHEATDFLYRDDFEQMKQAGVLTRFDTAFSRDQAHKVYVHHRMLDNSRELYDWLESGANFYVCGDAERMAKDVHQALLTIIQNESGCTLELAEEYVQRLMDQKRYQRDVY